MPDTSGVPAPRPRFMTLDEVATELGYKSRGPIYKLIYGGELPAVPIGPSKDGVLRVKRTEFEAYCARQEAAGAERFGAA